MTSAIDMSAILSPISGDDPAGDDLRYTAVYDEIREARRCEEPIPQGDWEREVKCSDWNKVISTSVRALTESSKDLLIAAWLVEALTVTRGFEGVQSGLALLRGLLEDFWEDAYPRIEDDDYDYRLAPFEFLNDKLSSLVRQIPLTDPRATPGYGFLKWQESREVGYHSDQKPQREELISEGKLAAEEFDAAVVKSPAHFYQAQAQAISDATESFKALEAEVDERFGRHAPRLSDLEEALADCRRLVVKICREQKGFKDTPETATQGPGELEASPDPEFRQASSELPAGGGASSDRDPGPTPAATAGGFLAIPTAGGGGESQESEVWDEALRTMSSRGFKEALNLLLAAAGSQSSERGRNRYRFLVAKLCLKGGRPELARPIVEQLNSTIAELQLEKWESPFWISDIYQALHHCLTCGEDCGEDAARAKELFNKICIMDVTKALGARS